MFYDEFATLCAEKGISRTKACVDCGVSRTAWHKWENGATPNGATISKLAGYFNVSMDYLLGTEQQKESVMPEAETSDAMREVVQILNELDVAQLEDARKYLLYLKSMRES